MSDEHERNEQEQRSRAWYAIFGFGALTAGVGVIMRWMPDNPFYTPSEVPNTTRYNANQLTGAQAPMLSVRPSEMGSIGAGCRVSDVSLVQNWLGPLRQTTLQCVAAYGERARARGRRFAPDGWRATGAGESDGGVGDAGPVGCVVEFTFRDARGARTAAWTVSDDRTSVTPADALAREISSLTPGLRAR